MLINQDLHTILMAKVNVENAKMINEQVWRRANLSLNTYIANFPHHDKSWELLLRLT